MTIPQWAQRMDQLAYDGIPFLFILDFALADPLVIPLEEIHSETKGIRFSINKVSDNTSSSTEEINFSKFPVSYELYKTGFDNVLKAIKAGDTYLLNLCYSTKMTGLPSLKEIFDAVHAPYKLYVPNKFVVFSP